MLWLHFRTTTGNSHFSACRIFTPPRLFEQALSALSLLSCKDFFFLFSPTHVHVHQIHIPSTVSCYTFLAFFSDKFLVGVVRQSNTHGNTRSLQTRKKEMPFRMWPVGGFSPSEEQLMIIELISLKQVTSHLLTASLGGFFCECLSGESTEKWENVFLFKLRGSDLLSKWCGANKHFFKNDNLVLKKRQQLSVILQRGKDCLAWQVWKVNSTLHHVDGVKCCPFLVAKDCLVLSVKQDRWYHEHCKVNTSDALWFTVTDSQLLQGFFFLPSYCRLALESWAAGDLTVAFTGSAQQVSTVQQEGLK